MVDVSLFYSHFSSRKAPCNANYRCVVMLPIVSLTPSIAASALALCSMTELHMRSNFGAMLRQS